MLDLIGGGRHEPRDRRAALPLPAHGQGAHVVAVPQALGAQPGGGGAEGAAPRPHLVSGIGLGLGPRLGRPGYINLGHGEDVADASVAGMERAAHAVLDAAFARAACGGSTRRAPTGGRRGSWGAGWQRARAWPRRRRGRAPSGATRTRPAGAWTREAHEVKELSGAQLRRQWARDAELLGDHAAALPDPLGDRGERGARRRRRRAELAALRARACGSGSRHAGRSRRRRSSARWRWRLRRGAGDLEPARAQRRRRARGARTPPVAVYVKEALANGRLTARGAGPRCPRPRASAASTGTQLALARRARAAVGRRRAQRRCDGGAAGEQPGRARSGRGTTSWSGARGVWWRSRTRTGRRARR